MEDEGAETFLKEEYADCLSDIPSEYKDSESDVSDCEIKNLSVNIKRERVETDDSDDSFIQVRTGPRELHTSSDEQENDEDIDLDWSDVDPPRENEDFEGSEGPNMFPGDKDKVEDVASMFVGDDLLEFIVTETNKYYDQNSKGYKGKWTDVTVVELKKWFALVIIMGLVRKSRISDYWSSNPLIETPIFSKTMSRNRFRQIWTYLHFSDNENIPQNADRLFKVQQIINYFSRKFKENFNPGKNISIKEDIIPWHGRLNFRVHKHSKTSKCGIYLKMLCDSTTGYISNFKLCTGTGQTLQTAVMDLLTHCMDKWHHLYINNVYNGVELANKLLSRKIRMCGTIKSNRGIPQVLRQAKLKILDSIFKRKGEVLLQLWRTYEGKDMRMISTIHNADIVNTGRNYGKGNHSVQKPKCIIDYNQYMEGADYAEEFLTCYPIYRSTTKWANKVALYLINCGFFNAFKVHEHLNVNSKRKITYYDFLLHLSKFWIEDNGLDTSENLRKPTTSRGAYCDLPQRLSGNIRDHQLVKISETQRRKRKRCRVCYANKIRKDTYFMCKFCKVPLHLGECFANYHLKKNY